jgi:hypothetical protein
VDRQGFNVTLGDLLLLRLELGAKAANAIAKQIKCVDLAVELTATYDGNQGVCHLAKKLAMPLGKLGWEAKHTTSSWAPACFCSIYRNQCSSRDAQTTAKAPRSVSRCTESCALPRRLCRRRFPSLPNIYIYSLFSFCLFSLAATTSPNLKVHERHPAASSIGCYRAPGCLTTKTDPEI